MRTAGSSAEGTAVGRLAEAEVPEADQVLDAVGLFCPIPIVRTAALVRRMEPGRVLEVRADDPVTLVDMPNWCRGARHDYLGWTPDGTELRLFVEVGPGRLPRRPGGGENGS